MSTSTTEHDAATHAEEHDHPTDMTFIKVAVILAVITAPPPEAPTTRVTIPEGLRITQIARSVHEQLGIPAKRFLAAIEGTEWSLPPYLPPSAASPEGFLFPDTYEFLAALFVHYFYLASVARQQRDKLRWAWLLDESLLSLTAEALFYL